MILHEIEIYKKYFFIKYFIDESSMAPIYHFNDKKTGKVYEYKFTSIELRETKDNIISPNINLAMRELNSVIRNYNIEQILDEK